MPKLWACPSPFGDGQRRLCRRDTHPASSLDVISFQALRFGGRGHRLATSTPHNVVHHDDGKDAPQVLGHADFEAQNLRWHGQQVHTVHDWDSLAWQPESALAGAASGAFPRPPGVPPSLASIESSEAFLATYQQARSRAFSVEEQQIAWAASLWPAAHNARWEALFGAAKRPSADALRAQAEIRLARADA
jgi:hypothetical protein